MKTYLLATLLPFFSSWAYSQNFGGMENVLNMPCDSIIKTNSLMNNRMGVHFDIVSVDIFPSGGFYIVYKTWLDGMDTITEQTYFFNKNKRCYSMSIDCNIDGAQDQIQTLKENDFYIVNQSTLYAKNEDLKAQHYTLPKEKRAVFIYSRKRTISPTFK